MNKLFSLFIALVSLSIMTSCQSTTDQPPLRVGVSANYPPVIFKEQGQYKGIEADLARALAKELGREVDFVEMKWNSLIPALQRNKVDIIMSGMSITPERNRQVLFTQSYFQISQMLLVRRSEAGRFRRPGKKYYIKSGIIVGVERGTTGEKLASKYLPGQRIRSYNSVEEGKAALKKGDINCFVHDAPTIWQYIDGKKDPQLTGLYWNFSKEKLAWAVSRTRPRFAKEINAILNKWRYSGISSRIVSKWIPVRVNYK